MSVKCAIYVDAPDEHALKRALKALKRVYGIKALRLDPNASAPKSRTTRKKTKNS